MTKTVLMETLSGELFTALATPGDSFAAQFSKLGNVSCSFR